MNGLIRAIKFNSSKLFSSRTWWIVLIIVGIIQPLFALINSSQIATIGIDATVATHPDLFSDIPPLAYIGFDIPRFGQSAIVVLGAIIGASEYKENELRTTFLCFSNRLDILLGKLLSFLIGSVIISVLSIIITIAITHIGLGEQGLHPFILSSRTWQFIVYTTTSWILLMLFSFSLGFFFRYALIPIILIIPQVATVLGDWLAINFDWGRFLPVTAANSMFVLPVEMQSHEPLVGGIILLMWTLIFLLLATHRFMNNDIGRNY